MPDYPKEILPLDFFRRKINFDSPIFSEMKEFFVCRKISKPIEKYFFDDGRPRKIIDIDTCLGKHLIGLSMNLMGTPFKESYLPYRCFGTAGKDWQGEYIALDDYIDDTDEHIGFPLYYSSKSIHRRKIPYEHAVGNKAELDSISNSVKDIACLVVKKYPIDIAVEYELFIRHRPVNFNYWHVQMEIKVATDPDSKTFDKHKGWLMKMYRHSVFGILEKSYILDPVISPLPRCIACYLSGNCRAGLSNDHRHGNPMPLF